MGIALCTTIDARTATRAANWIRSGDPVDRNLRLDVLRARSYADDRNGPFGLFANQGSSMSSTANAPKLTAVTGRVRRAISHTLANVKASAVAICAWIDECHRMEAEYAKRHGRWPRSE
jgi:hypothetical protein